MRRTIARTWVDQELEQGEAKGKAAERMDALRDVAVVSSDPAEFRSRLGDGSLRDR